MASMYLTSANRNQAIHAGSPSIAGLIADLGTTLADTFANLVRATASRGSERHDMRPVFGQKRVATRTERSNHA